MLGDPLFVDETTMTWSRTEFARICVRLNFAKKIPSGIWIEGKTKKFYQPIVYEGLPKICFNCGYVGHLETNCTLPHAHPTPTPIAPPTIASPTSLPPPPLLNQAPPPLSTSLPMAQLPPTSPSPMQPNLAPLLSTTPSQLPSSTISPMANPPPNSTPLVDSRPSEVAAPIVVSAPQEAPHDEGWITKRNRRHGGVKPQRRLANYFVPWRRHLKPNLHSHLRGNALKGKGRMASVGLSTNLKSKSFDLLGESSSSGKDVASGRHIEGCGLDSCIETSTSNQVATFVGTKLGIKVLNDGGVASPLVDQ